MLRKATILSTLGALALAGCSEREEILPGNRMNVRDVLETRADPLAQDPGNSARAVALGAQGSNADWAQSGVSPFARTTHAAFSGAFQPIWQTSIGAGDSRRKRLNADPVVAGGRIYTLDSEHVVRATSTSGEALWSRDLTPLRDKNYEAQGGGIAVEGGRLYVASGFGTVSALDPASGAELWVQRLGNTATGAPSVRDGVVYLVSGDSVGWALEADSGRIRWQVEGVGDVANVAGAPSPAIGDERVVFSFGNGTVQAVFRQGGLGLWSVDLLGRRNGVALAGIDDITGDPLIVGDRVYAGNHSGNFVALSVHDGERLWTAREGALGPAWPLGSDSVVFVSDRNELVRLDAATGDKIWAVDLPGYVPTRRNPQKRRDAAYANHGPILAGGRLIVASSDGFIRAFDPENGSEVSKVAIKGGATTRPVVAGGVLYVVSGDGVLHAYR
ncbi:outer membrane protein assembly factor BamB family protein [Tropicibacter oceani]|uniref:PQQ-binding-like beta-propeller repeat protein n=1 Tax=Tropicibacter oceani TaxID=3058420 RepID=A0ABY8QF61_9RHOB|nr:PQQ-like beta-propeller repeat protein [Tropicibacter oceani]WGW03269.1 PQQ-binding-like beta-propeller repeat protein [Tropicibacter oceani]